jgi:hypothetical protein
MGYPNAYDRQFGRTGAHLMVHGACSSSGCYSMSDDQIAEIYALVREAHNGGQRAVQMQALPFRMTPENMARHRYDQNIAFWRNLKEGVDKFEVARLEPRVSVCAQRYSFNRTEDCREDPSAAEILAAARAKQREDEAKVAELVRQGTPAVKIVYQDGGQHARFTQVLMNQGEDALNQHAAWGSRAVGISRPDAIVSGPREVAVASASARPAAAPSEPQQAQLAAAPAPAARTSIGRSASQPAAPAASAAATSAPAEAQPATASTGGFWTTVSAFNPFAAPAPAPQPAAAPAAPAPRPAQRRAEGAPSATPRAAASPQASAPAAQPRRTAAVVQ